MCYFCRFQRLYYPEKHHELPPGTKIDAKITTRKIAPPSESDYSFVMESLVASTTRRAYKEIKRYNFDRAEELLIASKACQPSNSRIYAFYALLYLQQEDLENALASVKTALRLNNSNGESFLIASQIYRQMEKYDMALRALEIGLVCAPANADNVEIRKALEEEILELKTQIPSLSITVAPKSPETPATPKETSLLLPSRLSVTILTVFFCHLDFASAKKMELVSKEWNKTAKSKEIQHELLVRHTEALVDLLSVPKDAFSLAMFADALKCWVRLEAQSRLRNKLRPITLEDSFVELKDPADFSAPRYQEMKQILQGIPHYFMLLYSIHNGMEFYLRDRYTCSLYPVDSPKFSPGKTKFEQIAIPYEFQSKVQQLCLEGPVIGKLKISVTAERLKKVAFDVWNNWNWGDEDEKELPKVYILMDTRPLSEGTMGQLLIIEDEEVVDVLPGGVAQLLEFLTVLATCNLVSNIGMVMRQTADNHLPDTMEDTLSKLNPKAKPKKLGLFRKIKRYKSAYKGFQCTMRN